MGNKRLRAAIKTIGYPSVYWFLPRPVICRRSLGLTGIAYRESLNGRQPTLGSLAA